MRMRLVAVVVAAAVAWPVWMRAEDVSARVKKAVERSTLDQPGTKPFHLKATLAPSSERDKDSRRTGEVEIWWVSPEKWRRELRSPEFHQVEIVNGGRDWQKNEGDYFPEWLREMAVALVKPVPELDKVLARVKSADVKTFMGQTHAQWMTVGTDGTTSKGIGAGIALTDATGLEFYGGDVGWDGLFHDYQEFHGRMVARTVSGGGSPEVTAKVVVLDDLGSTPAGFFDGDVKSGSYKPVKTVVLEELALRKNLLPGGAATWPPLENGPLEGASIADIVVDRDGHVRDVGTLVTDNPGVRDAASAYIQAMRFKPYLADGVAVQVVSTMTLSFKTVRPAGSESFDSSRTFFDRARKLGFPAVGATSPYVLRAEFTTRGSSGVVETGTYTDTWVSDNQWRREAVIGKSRFVRSRNGEKRYLLGEGPEEALLRIVLKEMEPIVATDSFAESDWRIKHDLVTGFPTVRVASGFESPDGTLDPQARAYWFDETGQLVKTHGYGLETRRLEFSDFDGMRVARRVDVLSGGNLRTLLSPVR